MLSSMHQRTRIVLIQSVGAVVLVLLAFFVGRACVSLARTSQTALAEDKTAKTASGRARVAKESADKAAGDPQAKTTPAKPKTTPVKVPRKTKAGSTKKPSGDRAAPPGEAPRSYGGDCTRSACHASLVGYASVHGPVAVKSCSMCHVPVEGRGHAFDLARKEEDLCIYCHDTPKEKRVVHKPFAQKNCLSCHDPHGGLTPSLLVKEEEPGGLCLQCHEKQTEKNQHKPYADGECSQCHVAHQSDHKALTGSGEGCLGCHTALATTLKTAKIVHKPVASGDCAGCHKGHASRQPSLLAAAYDRAFYTAFTPRKFELCFRCHPVETFTEPEDTKTGFRDGTRNLHLLHVNKTSKGRTCTVCHPSHEGTEAWLVRKETQFGSWKLPIGFEATPDGGKCATGCHRELSYSRGRPSKPQGGKPKGEPRSTKGSSSSQGKTRAGAPKSPAGEGSEPSKKD